ncbi:hypothetical protein QJQ45_015004 [Haematococcus lacustris]|nr:hypothetical protein QJQ45_015004 [Haematococcus lacustris]
MAAEDSARFLPALVLAMQQVHQEGQDISTRSFALLMEHILGIFDYLGAVLHFAKADMITKSNSLKQVAVQLPLLRDVVQEDSRRGTVTVKDSCARNMHRLVCVVTFMRVLLEQFARSPSVTVKEAATAAYEQALAPIHTYVIRTAVWAGMYVLPSREHFMHQLGETEQSARQSALAFLACSKDVEQRVLRLFAGINMPASTPTSNILAGLWGHSTAATPAR